MIFPFRHTNTKDFLALILALVFLCVSLWQSFHARHQHSASDGEFVFWHMSFVSGHLDKQYGDADPFRAPSHDVPDKTARLYKHQTGTKTLRVKTDGGKWKMPAVVCTQDIAIVAPESSTTQVSYVMGGCGTWIDGHLPTRAPPVTSNLA